MSLQVYSLVIGRCFSAAFLSISGLRYVSRRERTAEGTIRFHEAFLFHHGLLLWQLAWAVATRA
jgi:hypothetical protein